MAKAKVTPKSNAKDKIFVGERIRTLAISTIVYDTNTKGTTYLKGIQEGAIYGKEITAKTFEPGVYTLVRLAKANDEDFDMLALNRPTTDERLAFVDGKRKQHNSLSVAEISALMGVELIPNVD